MASYLGLPPLSPALKSIAPFLQRADELKEKEPIVAYWCLYYAAQNGIALKAKDNVSRSLLLEILGTLEQMKSDIGPNDAIDMEAASAAYVENFAVKVFSIADNEDRSGNSTRSTAKKFLAAANFLEVLKTFPKTDITESVEEKIRYAKWKAADIAKAFREGRKPTPGPAGDELTPQEADLSQVPPPLNFTDSSMTLTASSPPKSGSSSPLNKSPTQGSPTQRSPVTPTLKRTTPSPPVIQDMPPPQLTPPRATLGVDRPFTDPSSPGNWSTVATPGTVTNTGTPTEETDQFGPNSSFLHHNPSSPESPTAGRSKHKKRSGSESSNGSLDSNGIGRRRKDSVSSSPKKVHFVISQPDVSQPSVSGHSRSGSGASLPPSADPFSSAIHAPPPPPIPNSFSNTHPPAPSTLVGSHIPPGSVSVPTPYSRPPDKDVELTPSLVSQAQKHCRYAISSLDYDDATQAKKELRAALALLGASV
ncbi:DUF605-domain-containing protein [Dendrothele bispora CBS 962.96]|uniref:DUF605-domain-containing protein n=1 Tax=Dendrothele bispora (strain CBS 962.96) TaxID=1314807 RepID=A0A4S8MWM0_DENBC|nr:DUF605-domain-containing protein [Dendrothele bispora CBS 962.96]